MDENMGTYDKKNILKRFNDQKQEYDLIVCEYNNIKEELIKTNQILNSKSEFINYLQTDNKKLNKELVYLIKDFKISKKNLSDKITEIQSKNLIDVENYANAINKVHRLDSDLRKLNEKNSNLKKEINKYLIKLNDKNDEIHLLKKDEKEKQDLLKENMDKINELRSFITAHNIKFSNNLKKSPKTNFTSIFPKKSINSNDNILESEKYNDNDYNLIKSSGLFDSKWYQVIYLNSEEKIDPIEHYIVIGDKKCYNPHPSFNVKEYKRLNSLSSNENALLDYIVNGVYTSNNNHDFIEDLRDSQEYRILNESILLNNSWYYSTHPDVKKLHMDPVIHYLKGGFKGQYDPNPSFSSKFYLKKHPKVKELKQNPLVDYITSYTHNYELLVDMNLNDTKENLILEESLDYLLINESKLFDKNWYKKEYNIINDPIIDYITNGYKNKDPCSEFDTNWYKIEYNLKENENPLLHYIFNGEIENKSISKNKEMVFDKTYYDTVKNTSYEEIKYIVESHECKIIEYSLFLDKKWYTKKYNVPDAVLDYLTTGLSNFKNPNSHFDAKWYFENNKKLMDNITYPLVDYEIRGKYNNSFTENFLKQNPVIIEETQEYQIIVSNSVFDQKWYINKYLNGDIKQDPVKHYLTKGLEKYYNPNSQFNMIWYIANYMDKKQRYIVPLVYYICNEDPDTPTKPDNISNEEELQLLNKILILEDYDLLKNSKYFDSKFYMDNNIDIPLEMDPINHYLKYGWKENRIPSLYFDPEFYLRYNPDIKKANVNPLVHFINKKNKEKRPYHNAKMQLSVSDEITAEMISDYNIIQESDWFDQRWYESNNPIIESENLDPFLHYIVYGVLEGIDPHPLFSTSKYLEDNTDIAGLNLNPLVHYIKSGQFESRINYISDKFNTFYNEDNEYTPCEINNILSRITNKISIILPVYADFEGIKKCVQSILNNTSINYELIIVNDGSNLDIELFLDSLKNISNIKIVTNENNIGFIGSINKGIKLSSNDVVILHEDTIVTKGWLSKLVIAAYSDNNIGTVTPFSNSSDINIDALDNINDIDDTGYKLGKLSINNIESPVGSSFCMYIKKDVIDDIGLFDESINYHYSDVDFTSKALYNGWLNIRNDSIFVYHNGTISKLDSNDLKEDTKNLLLKSYPDLFDKWFLFKESKKLKDSLNNINNLQNIKKRVLYVTTSNKENKPLLDKIYHRLNEDYEIFILSIKKNKLSLMLHSLNKSGMIKQWTINNDIEDYINAYFNIITNLNIDNVFIKSLNEYTSPEYNNQVILFLLAFYLEIETVTINNLNVLINDNFNENISLKEVIKNKSNEINFSKNKLVIYTVITDNSDEISKPLYINDNFDYICFTNNPNLKSEFWQIKLIENIELLKYKTMPHKYLSKYDYSLWIDPNINIINNLEECLHKYLKNNKFLCIENIEDNNKIIQKQLKQYESEGYLVNNNCIASEFIFRKHDDKDIINTMNCWYDESIKEGYDPNLSLNYACWKTNIDIDILKIPKNRNQYFIKKYTHLKSLFDLKYTNKQVNDMISSLKNQVSIIVPIYNKYNETKKCIESIIKNTNPNNKLILINDCSTDKKINKLLGSYENNEFIQIIRNDKRLGYINCINKGIHLSLNDVVLLNQETIVTPRWLSKLILTAYSSSDIDVVVPFSNNSIFNLCKTNDSINNINKLVENISLDKYMEVPNNIQYCTYIKQSSIFKFGFIDTEGKYLVKTSENKVKTVLDDTTYIYNTNTPKKELFNESIEYKIIKNRIETLLNSENVNKYNKKRLLYVIHEGSGGTLHTSMELISQLTNEYDIYILSAGQTSIKLLRYNHIIQKETGKNDDAFKENISKLYEWELTTKYTLKKPYIPEYKRIYFNVLKILKIDMIHIRHLIRHTLDLPYIANKLEIPIILSFHDFYYICPAYTLIDDQNNYCAGKCSPIENYNGQCGVTVGLNVPILKTFVYTWRSYMKRLFNVCELFITTSNKAKKLYQEIYPELKDKEFKIIEHGRDIITPNNPLKRINKPVINNPTKILFPGHLSIAKGGKLIENIKKEDKDNLLELHYIGSISGMKELGKYGKDHGFYDRNKFNELVQDINPSFIGILSIWPETYCHTLTESWGAGIPVLTTNHGALGERVKENGGGWFISEDPKKAYKQIISIIQDENEYNNKVNEIKDITFKTTKEMSNEYKQIYEEIFKKKQDG